MQESKHLRLPSVFKKGEGTDTHATYMCTQMLSARAPERLGTGVTWERGTQELGIRGKGRLPFHSKLF